MQACLPQHAWCVLAAGCGHCGKWDERSACTGHAVLLAGLWRTSHRVCVRARAHACSACVQCVRACVTCAAAGGGKGVVGLRPMLRWKAAAGGGWVVGVRPASRGADEPKRGLIIMCNAKHAWALCWAVGVREGGHHHQGDSMVHGRMVHTRWPWKLGALALRGVAGGCGSGHEDTLPLSAAVHTLVDPPAPALGCLTCPGTCPACLTCAAEQSGVCCRYVRLHCQTT